MPNNMNGEAKAAFRGLFGTLFQYYRDIAHKELVHWSNKKAIDGLWKHVHSTRLVKTIWQVEKSIDLMEFYHPSRVYVGRDRKTISSIEDFPKSERILIEGVAGQGKSILLRYLCCTELEKAKRVPIFLELRRLQAGQRLMDHIVAAFTNYGLEFNEEVFQVLAQSDRLVLLLDAFDEVNEEVKKQLFEDLETIAVRFPELRMIVTSRPESELKLSPQFRVVRISYLEDKEYEDVIDKLMGNGGTKKNLLESSGMEELGIMLPPEA